MQPSGLRFAIPVMRMVVKKLTACFLIFPAGFFATSTFALEVTELAGAAHGYPGLCSIDGKKIADGEFRQWVENMRLHVMITYKFPDGESFGEQRQFDHQQERIREKCSGKNPKEGRRQLDSPPDFLLGMPTET